MKTNITESLYHHKMEFFFVAYDHSSATLLTMVLKGMNYQSHIGNQWAKASLFPITGLTPKLKLNNHLKLEEWIIEMNKLAKMCNCTFDGYEPLCHL